MVPHTTCGTSPDAISRLERAVHGISRLWFVVSQSGDGIGAGQTRLLAAVDAGVSGLRELSDLLDVDHSTVSVAVTSLVARGHVERGPDPRDRRRQRVTITASGRAVLERARARTAFVHATLRETLSVAEVEQLEGLLERVERALQSTRG